jgi:hypothetical protein
VRQKAALNRKTPIHPLLATSDGQPAATTEAAAALLTALCGRTAANGEMHEPALEQVW